MGSRATARLPIRLGGPECRRDRRRAAASRPPPAFVAHASDGPRDLPEPALHRAGTAQFPAYVAAEPLPSSFAEVLAGHPDEPDAQRAQLVLDPLLPPEFLLRRPPVSRPPVLDPAVELHRQRGIGVPAVHDLQQSVTGPELDLGNEGWQPQRGEDQAAVGLQPGLRPAVGQADSAHRPWYPGHPRLPLEHAAQLCPRRQPAQQRGVDGRDRVHLGPRPSHVDQRACRRGHPVGPAHGDLVVRQCRPGHQPTATPAPPVRIRQLYRRGRRPRPRQAPDPGRGATTEDGGAPVEADRHGESVQSRTAAGPFDLGEVGCGHEHAGAQPHPCPVADGGADLALTDPVVGEVGGGEDAQPAADGLVDGEGDSDCRRHGRTVRDSGSGPTRSPMICGQRTRSWTDPGPGSSDGLGIVGRLRRRRFP
ncbi:hypothetical protein SAMN05216574_103278 [Blastococcus tunisiensis]|uniref:Uncharacterized protein n=1 Tax=Blastococcus tunisiensis TaxID=1798228 RepID=A0A1I2ABN0_9ACTN|nr:hypothetical protein SAMN05216574_103278 [Blastococcus sp. DSM 46838]